MAPPKTSIKKRLSRGGRFPLYFSILYSVAFLFLYLPASSGFHYFEELWQDQLFRMRESRLAPGDSRIVIAAMDNATLQKYGFPLSRKLQAGILRKLKAHGADTAALDIMFLEPRPHDSDLVAATRHFGRAVNTFFINSQETPNGSLLQAQLPIKGLEKASQFLGFPNIGRVLSGDGHIRRALLFDPAIQNPKKPGQKAPALAAAAAASYSGKSLSSLLGEYGSDPSRAQIINFRKRAIWKAHPRNPESPLVVSPYRVISYLDILSDNLTPEQQKALKKALVFAGSTAIGAYDHYPNPFSSDVAGVEFQATIADNILNKDFLKPISRLPTFLFALTMIWLAFFSMRFPPLAGSLAALLLFAAYTALAVFAFARGYHLDYVGPAFALISSFFVQIVYRVLAEERAKRFITALFGQFVSPEVVGVLAKDPSKIRLGGEKREMTILFLDIAHFTTISEKLSSEALIAFLNRYLSAFSAIVQEHGGAVDKYIGDCVMAFWNAPIEVTEHRLKACTAALDCLKALDRLNADIDPGLPETPAIRIGLNSGVVTVGLTGSENKLQYTTIGDEVNLASRLEGANKFFKTTILASENTYLPASERAAGRELGLVRVLGKEVPVRVFELVGMRGSLREPWEKIISVHEAGLSAFKDGRYDYAARSFEEILKLKPGDGPASLYLEACRKRMSEGSAEKPSEMLFNLTAK